MPLGLVTRPHRRLIASVTAVLIALQAFLAGLASARAAAILAADPIGIAVICQGAGGGDSGDGTAPDPIKAAHLCCVACLVGSPAATLPEQPALPKSNLCRDSISPAVSVADVPIAKRAIRAGQSRAPPHRG